ncbi:hypothetical protein D9M68_876360 [compost metagenome]
MVLEHFRKLAGHGIDKGVRLARPSDHLQWLPGPGDTAHFPAADECCQRVLHFQACEAGFSCKALDEPSGAECFASGHETK